MILDEMAGRQSPLCSTTETKIPSSSKTKIPFVTVVTDLGTAHPTWFSSSADLCFVATPELKEIAMRNNVPESQIRVYGLPLRESFWAADPRAKEDIRRALGLFPNRPTCLILGGGEGVGGLPAVTEGLLKALTAEHPKQFQIIVVCGRSQQSKSDIERRFAAFRRKGPSTFGTEECFESGGPSEPATTNSPPPALRGSARAAARSASPRRRTRLFHSAYSLPVSSVPSGTTTVESVPSLPAVLLTSLSPPRRMRTLGFNAGAVERYNGQAAGLRRRRTLATAEAATLNGKRTTTVVPVERGRQSPPRIEVPWKRTAGCGGSGGLRQKGAT